MLTPEIIVILLTQGPPYVQWPENRLMRKNYIAHYKIFKEHQLNSSIFSAFPGAISNSRRFPGFPGVVHTLKFVYVVRQKAAIGATCCRWSTTISSWSCLLCLSACSVCCCSWDFNSRSSLSTDDFSLTASLNCSTNHIHRIDKYLDTLLANQTAQKALHRPLPEVVIAKWRTARVIISLFLPNSVLDARNGYIRNVVV